MARKHTAAEARRVNQKVVRQLTIPIWADSVFKAVRDSIYHYVERIDLTYPDTASKRAACKIRSININAVNNAVSFHAPTHELLNKTRAQIILEMEDIIHKQSKCYGHPAVNFKRAARLQAITHECPDEIMRHILSAICVKIARITETPMHDDSWLDVANYALIGLSLIREIHKE